MNPESHEIFARYPATRIAGFVMAIAGLVILVVVVLSWSPSHVTIEYLMVPAMVLMVCGGVLTNRRILIREGEGSAVRLDQWLFGFRITSRELPLSDGFKITMDVQPRPKRRHLIRILLNVGEHQVMLGATHDAPLAKPEYEAISRWLAPSSSVNH